MDELKPEELAAEQADVVIPKEEEIRASIIEEFGFDEEADAEKIDKAVQRDLAQREKLSKAIEQKIKHRTAAEELRTKVLPEKKEEVKPVEENLSQQDMLYIAKSDIHDEDLDEVIEWSKFKKVSVKEAHKQLKAQLDIKAEERATAAAAHTTGGAHGSAKVSGEDLLAKAEQTGEVPDDDEGMRKLFQARQARKMNRSKR